MAQAHGRMVPSLYLNTATCAIASASASTSTSASSRLSSCVIGSVSRLPMSSAMAPESAPRAALSGPPMSGTAAAAVVVSATAPGGAFHAMPVSAVPNPPSWTLADAAPVAPSSEAGMVLREYDDPASSPPPPPPASLPRPNVAMGETTSATSPTTTTTTTTTAALAADAAPAADVDTDAEAGADASPSRSAQPSPLSGTEPARTTALPTAGAATTPSPVPDLRAPLDDGPELLIYDDDAEAEDDAEAAADAARLLSSSPASPVHAVSTPNPSTTAVIATPATPLAPEGARSPVALPPHDAEVDIDSGHHAAQEDDPPQGAGWAAADLDVVDVDADDDAHADAAHHETTRWPALDGHGEGDVHGADTNTLTGPHDGDDPYHDPYDAHHGHDGGHDEGHDGGDALEGDGQVVDLTLDDGAHPYPTGYDFGDMDGADAVDADSDSVVLPRIACEFLGHEYLLFPTDATDAFPDAGADAVAEPVVVFSDRADAVYYHSEALLTLLWALKAALPHASGSPAPLRPLVLSIPALEVTFHETHPALAHVTPSDLIRVYAAAVAGDAAKNALPLRLVVTEEPVGMLRFADTLAAVCGVHIGHLLHAPGYDDADVDADADGDADGVHYEAVVDGEDVDEVHDPEPEAGVVDNDEDDAEAFVEADHAHAVDGIGEYGDLEGPVDVDADADTHADTYAGTDAPPLDAGVVDGAAAHGHAALSTTMHPYDSAYEHASSHPHGHDLYPYADDGGHDGAAAAIPAPSPTDLDAPDDLDAFSDDGADDVGEAYPVGDPPNDIDADAHGEREYALHPHDDEPHGQAFGQDHDPDQPGLTSADNGLEDTEDDRSPKRAKLA
ncbi:hypothetical protein CXG81DRAFT_19954 [Caulochytrium protostelioides]|uniref:Uncharacterized protein n=1 Tax=Caulochytrium protostelioides TaxID=1555241 RepID=A0A4P9X4N2_9FUNG|nr:hypothetical protein CAUPRSCDRAFT_10492 [Caulochytrium protostelioides]RKP00046.1 hypothetical protein CXG81DRAFT_19954 [Caulochytrium protostelioides]|eukprot:RKP00046.1 hypothetical protein CXG81DRAFT_19954 [Caulochytrium protostelioides]